MLIGFRVSSCLHPGLMLLTNYPPLRDLMPQSFGGISAIGDHNQYQLPMCSPETNLSFEIEFDGEPEAGAPFAAQFAMMYVFVPL